MNIFSNISDKLRTFKYFLTAFRANRSLPKTTYAQYQEDIVAEFLLGSVHKFIDIGATDGIGLSNTFLFALKGARGILFEPVPLFFKRLRLLYLFNQNCVCIREGISDKSAILKMRLGGDFSTLEETFNPEHTQAVNTHSETFPTIMVRVNTLTSWLSKYREFRDVDLISIDVEDHELNVLRGIDFNIMKAKCFIIETHEYKEGHSVSYFNKYYEDMKSILKKAGYTAALENKANTFWLRNDIIDENKINKVVSNFSGYLKIDLRV
jgi:FkbM family methyltransferase